MWNLFERIINAIKPCKQSQQPCEESQQPCDESQSWNEESPQETADVTQQNEWQKS